MKSARTVLICTLISILPSANAMQSDSNKTILLAQSNVRPLVSGERVRVNKITRDLENAMQTMNQGGLEPFQSSSYVKKWQDALQRHKSALQKYPQVNDPDVKAAHAKLAEMENMVAFGINHAEKQKSQLGDVQTNLKNIEHSVRSNPPPKQLNAPFTQQQASSWVAAALKAQQANTHAIEYIQSIASTAHLPNNPGTVQSGAPYDKQDLNRLLNFANRNQEKINTTIKQTQDSLLFQLKTQDNSLNYLRGLDPEVPKYRMNAFLKEGADIEIYQRLDKELALAKSAQAWLIALNKPANDNVTARIKEIEQIRTRYGQQRKTALGDSKLPAAKNTDANLLSIAQTILAKPKYEFGEHGPIVLTTDKVVDREKQLSETEYNDIDFSLNGDITLKGTETTWTYKWQEFKFATPLKDSATGNWHIWWITAKKFSSGSSITPIGEWVSGKATKGDLILPENF